MTKNVLFIHGNSLNKSIFKFQQGENFHFMDLPGHGENSKAHSDFGLEQMLDHIENFIYENGLKDLIIVGHSLGGHLAVDLLSRDTSFTISGLFLIGTPPLKFPPDMTAFKEHPAVMHAFSAELTDQQVKLLAEAFGSADFSEMIKNTNPAARGAVGVDLQSGKSYNEVKLLANFKGKLAICLGENDPLVNGGYIENLELPMWKGKILKIENAGHSPQYENSGDFNRLLSDFID